MNAKLVILLGTEPHKNIKDARKEHAEDLMERSVAQQLRTTSVTWQL